MPIIVYKCVECGKEYEEIVPMSAVKSGERTFIDCKKCGHPAPDTLSVPSPMQWGCKRF